MSDYDDKDCTGWDLSDRTDMDGLTIHGICLSQHVPDTACLPANLTGVTFLACNLDNVLIPPGNIVDPTCSTRRFMNNPDDNSDWLVDENNNFISQLN
jgi:hypothetical protein